MEHTITEINSLNALKRFKVRFEQREESISELNDRKWKLLRLRNRKTQTEPKGPIEHH